MKKGNKRHRSEEQKNTLYNIKILYKVSNDYFSMVSEAKLKELKEQDLKY